jgi:hypothetical protein
VAHWPGVVALELAVIAAMAALGGTFWRNSFTQS